ncbi:hypothetical protein AUEXF2481DRAFT_437889 [Aureobasidium subglaciale EXF-2481]|uniref:Uncharacterized protein n=1 Tax=Aureobasidium subglaciale (strain EXF-2481) TaxID=1043005 RepID=A0A074Y8C2_AURSE|nr:uncharacterized protein AUEXF2481DRAFT_437889 [Aureobasidium subglaciale EXF-2481]KEQ92219.1 hypothetical protein AUEXF2481DRAFT_437889 [Aureobasidium subglaciale EXF-2481]
MVEYDLVHYDAVSTAGSKYAKRVRRQIIELDFGNASVSSSSDFDLDYQTGKDSPVVVSSWYSSILPPLADQTAAVSTSRAPLCDIINITRNARQLREATTKELLGWYKRSAMDGTACYTCPLPTCKRVLPANCRLSDLWTHASIGDHPKELHSAGIFPCQVGRVVGFTDPAARQLHINYIEKEKHKHGYLILMTS